MEEDVEEVGTEMNVGEAPPTGDLAPEQAPVPPATMLATAGICVGGPSGRVAEPGVSLSAQGKAPAAQT